jgi:hypothetical protein
LGVASEIGFYLVEIGVLGFVFDASYQHRIFFIALSLVDNLA